MKIILRGQNEPAAQGRSQSGEDARAMFAELVQVADYPAPDPLLAWDDIEQICALDVDVSKGYPFPDFNFRHVAEHPDPPAWYWRTHGGGFRGIFFANEILSAEERAAVFATTAIRRAVIFQKLEFLRWTRHPLYVRTRDGGKCGRVERTNDNPDYSHVRSMLLGDAVSVSEDQVEAWLSDNGFVRGVKYDHSRCPIAVGVAHATGGSPPVVALESGVFCFVCRANGVGRGFLRYSQLIHPSERLRIDNKVRQCVSGKGHWEHVRSAVKRFWDITGEIAEVTFRAVLKLWHVADMAVADPRREPTAKLLDGVFFPKAALVRVQGKWMTPDFKPFGASGLPDVLGSLPAAKFVDAEGNIKRCQRTFGMLQSGGDLSDYGYPDLIPIHGVDGNWREILDMTRSAPGEERPGIRCVVDSRPPFGSCGFDSTLADAEQHIEASFPGVRFDLLKSLIAGKFVAQLDVSEPPMLFITGQSGASKTAHVLLAAELCGDRVTKVPFGTSAEEWLRHVAKAANAGSFLMVDEIAKTPHATKNIPQFLLQVQRGTQYRELFYGPLLLPPLPVLAMADTTLPGCFRSDAQLTRRVVAVDLGCGIEATGQDWRETCGTGEIRGWRAASEDNTRAADTITQHVMHEYVEADFLMIARRLGFTTFRDAVGDDDNQADHRDFFKAVCDAPDATDRSFRGRGYKRIDPMQFSTPVETAYLALTGGVGDVHDARATQSITGAQWGRIIGVKGVELDFMRRSGRKAAFVRFRLGKSGSASVKINGEIAETEAVEPNLAQPAEVQRPCSPFDADVFVSFPSMGVGFTSGAY
jgi:hypothetical protein